MNIVDDKIKENFKYSCNEYREEMILVLLKQRLANSELSEDDKRALIREIETIEKKMGFL